MQQNLSILTGQPSLVTGCHGEVAFSRVQKLVQATITKFTQCSGLTNPWRMESQAPEVCFTSLTHCLPDQTFKIIFQLQTFDLSHLGLIFEELGVPIPQVRVKVGKLQRGSSATTCLCFETPVCIVQGKGRAVLLTCSASGMPSLQLRVFLTEQCVKTSAKTKTRPANHKTFFNYYFCFLHRGICNPAVV